MDKKQPSKIAIIAIVIVCLLARCFFISMILPQGWFDEIFSDEDTNVASAEENPEEDFKDDNSSVDDLADSKDSDDESDEVKKITDSKGSVDEYADAVKKLRDKTDIKSTGIVRKQNVELQGGGKDKVTMLIYMNGSNLETEDAEATTDLSEIVAAGGSDNVNVIVQTMGTKKWHKYGIASDRSQIYSVDNKGLTLLKDDLGQLDCTKEKTLTDFVKWGVKNYPADRYILQFWNHGGGPVYGFGYDEWNKDEDATLTMDEIQSSLKDAGVYFDFIGMDCCIMSSLETCCALYDYTDYLILSEDFESGLGWSYEGMMRQLYKNSSTSTVDLAKIAIDDIVKANESNSEWGDATILTLIDESVMRVVFKAWKDFAFANESSLVKSNYSRKIKRSGRELPIIDKLCKPRVGGFVLPKLCKPQGNTPVSLSLCKSQTDVEYDITELAARGNDCKNTDNAFSKGILSDGYFSGWSYSADEDNPEMSDYYVTDIMAVANNIDSAESSALSAALSKAIVYSKATKEDEGLTGLSVTLPYGDKEFYSQLDDVFTNIGIDEEYVDWLEKFASSSSASNFYDYDKWDNDWSGWDDYEEEEYDWSDWAIEDDDKYWDDEDWWCIGGNCDYDSDDYDYDNDEYYSDYYDNYYDEYYDYYDDYYYDDGDYYDYDDYDYDDYYGW